MMKLSVVLLALGLALTSANCPLSCSGHGTCGADDKCTCYPNFQGLDCSERVCSFQLAFADVPSGDNEAHAYLECSGKGICDRKAGLCKCFAGYEGDACRRTSCPNGCSGHGTCELMDELAGANGFSFTSWEGKKHQVCKCDPYWEGVDCSERMCPRGDDPLTVSNSQNDVQSITISTGTGSFTLQYSDKFGALWTTRPINFVAARAAKDIEIALNGLPNEVIQGVTVTDETVTPGTAPFIFKVEFSNKYNSGPQTLLTCNTGGCDAAGCQPFYAGFTGGCTVAHYVVNTVDLVGNTEDAVCSNRGNCDKTTGQCSCHNGYYGEACEMQTALF